MSPFSRKELGIHSTPGSSTWSRRSSTPIGGSLGLEIKLREGLSPRVWGKEWECEGERANGRESDMSWWVRERFKTLVGPWWQNHARSIRKQTRSIRIIPEFPDSHPEVPGSQWFPEINCDWVDLICFWKFVQTSKLSHLSPPTIFLAKHSSFPVPTF